MSDLNRDRNGLEKQSEVGVSLPAAHGHSALIYVVCWWVTGLSRGKPTSKRYSGKVSTKSR